MQEKRKRKGNFNISLSWKWIISCCVSCLLVFLTLLGSSVGYGLWKEGEMMKEMEILGNWLDINPKGDMKVDDDFFLINIAYDKVLVDAFDEFQMPAGKRAVVDRNALYRLLDSVSDVNYKCILLDVRLYENDITESDSLLVAAINSSPRILIVDNPEGVLPVGIEREKVADASYGIHYLNSDFLKFRYQIDDKPGIALAAYNIADGKELDLSGHFPTDNGNLAQSNIYLPLYYKINSTYDPDYNRLIYNLRTDILDVYDKLQLSRLLDGKIIIIGDYTEGDLHNTYAGDMHGPVIIMNAIRALRMGYHIVAIPKLIIMFIIYLVLVISILSDVSVYLPEIISKSLVLRCLALMIGYSTVLALMDMGFYLSSGIMFDFYLPFIFLTLLNFFSDKRVIELTKLIFKKNE